MISISPASRDELPLLIALEEEVWPPGQRFTESNFLSQYAVFQEGMLVAREGQSLAGMFILSRVSYEGLPDKTWYGVSDDGDLERSFDPHGPDIYGVSMTVSLRCRRQGVGRSLVAEAKRVGKRLGAARLLLGSRLPEFHTSALSIEQYILTGNDSQLSFYNSCGLEVVGILPGYFSDPESRDFGVLMGATL